MTDELRKLALASLTAEETWHHEADLHGSLAYTYGESGEHYVEVDAAYIAAASPDVVLGLLAERNEAREAVKRLAGALEEIWRGGLSDVRSFALGEIDDPVVKKIVEGE
jgi:hypothetical protein